MTTFHSRAWAHYNDFARLKKALAPFKLNVTQGLLLAAAPAQDEDNESLNEIKGGKPWLGSNISYNLNLLEKRGLIVRHQCAEDHRMTMIHRTEKAIPVVEAIDEALA